MPTQPAHPLPARRPQSGGVKLKASSKATPRQGNENTDPNADGHSELFGALLANVQEDVKGAPDQESAPSSQQRWQPPPPSFMRMPKTAAEKKAKTVQASEFEEVVGRGMEEAVEDLLNAKTQKKTPRGVGDRPREVVAKVRARDEALLNAKRRKNELIRTKSNNMYSLRNAVEDSKNTGLDILDKLNRLTTKNAVRKKKADMDREKFGWAVLAKKLADERADLEFEMQRVMKGWAYAQASKPYRAQSVSVQQLSSVMRDILDEEDEKKAGRNTAVAALRGQVDELKYYVFQAVKATDPGLQEYIVASLQEFKHGLVILNDDLSQQEDELSADLAAFNLGLYEEKSMHNDSQWTTVEHVEGADEDLRDSFLKSLSLLEDTHETRLAILEEQYAPGDEVYQRRGGWSESDHYRFLHVYQHYLGTSIAHRKGGAFKGGRKVLFERLKASLSGKSMQEIEEHEDWYNRQRYYRQKRKAIIAEKNAARSELLEDARTALNKSAEERRMREQKELEITEFEREREKLHQKLKVLKDERAHRMEVDHSRQLEEERRQAEVAAREEQRRAEENKMKKEMVEEYRDMLKAQRESAEAAEAAEKEREAEEKKKQSKVNAVRVQFRKEEYAQKVEEMRRREEEAQTAEFDKEQRLQRLREQVQVNVEDDPDRVYKQTAASAGLLDEAGRPIKFTPATKPLFNVHGYDHRSLFKDTRFKILVALRAAGLDHTDYGRQVIMNKCTSIPASGAVPGGS